MKNIHHVHPILLPIIIRGNIRLAISSILHSLWRSIALRMGYRGLSTSRCDTPFLSLCTPTRQPNRKHRNPLISFPFFFCFPFVCCRIKDEIKVLIRFPSQINKSDCLYTKEIRTRQHKSSSYMLFEFQASLMRTGSDQSPLQKSLWKWIHLPQNKQNREER